MFRASNKKFKALIRPLGEMSVLDDKFKRKLMKLSARVPPWVAWLIRGFWSIYCTLRRSFMG